jgi:hypothetical protein
MQAFTDTHAAFYCRSIETSTYVSALTLPVSQYITESYKACLDIGAGSGVLTRACLRPGMHWFAVEPNSYMQNVLQQQVQGLENDNIYLHVVDSTWENLPKTYCADVVLACNVGATHHHPVNFFNAMAPRCRTMTWVVAAQAGPSTFCAAGFLPPELHGASTIPAVEITLSMLSKDQQPHHITWHDWLYRAEFEHVEAAVTHFIDRLNLKQADSYRRQAVSDYVTKHAEIAARGVVVACQKRSAVLNWSWS